MKEIVACLIFLMSGIIAQSKMKIFEIILFIILLLFIDSYLKISKQFDVDKKIKFKNFESLKKNLIIQLNVKTMKFFTGENLEKMDAALWKSK